MDKSHSIHRRVSPCRLRQNSSEHHRRFASTAKQHVPLYHFLNFVNQPIITEQLLAVVDRIVSVWVADLISRCLYQSLMNQPIYV